jgi:hypothetical protein
MSIAHLWTLATALMVSVFASLLVEYTLKRRWAKSHTRERLATDGAITILYRQCARWAAASSQDRSEVIALLHANYAAGYLWALKDICIDEDFHRITGRELFAFEQKITEIQDAAAQRLVEKCGESIPASDQALLEAMHYRVL